MVVPHLSIWHQILKPLKVLVTIFLHQLIYYACSVYLQNMYRGSSPNPPGGWVFFSPIWAEASQKKNPTPNFSFLVFLFRGRMKRKFLVENDQKENQTKIQLAITSWFGVNGPSYGVSSAKWLCLTMQCFSGIHNPLES